MIKKAFLTIAMISLFPLAGTADTARAAVANVPDTPTDASASHCGSKLYFISPKDGDAVKSPVTVRFGLRGMGVAPAGVEKECTGHHHLIVDAPLPPMDQPIEGNENNLHFGGGQTQADISLNRGKHTLQLILGDHNHVPHDPAVTSPQIGIIVE